jgi:hypothetical protein
LGFPSVAEFIVAVAARLPTLRRFEDLQDEESVVVARYLPLLTTLTELKLAPLGELTSYQTFAPLTRLEILSISLPWPPFEWAGLTALTHLHSLRHFALRNADVSLKQMRSFLTTPHFQTQLMTLVLESEPNARTWMPGKAPVGWIHALFEDTPCPGLESISLGYSDDPGRLNCFGGYSQLRTLHLGSASTTPAVYAHQYKDIPQQLTSLKELAIKWNYLVPLEVITGMTSLQSLILAPAFAEYRDLQDREKAMFLEMRNLRHVTFRVVQVPDQSDIAGLVRFLSSINVSVKFEVGTIGAPKLYIQGMTL